MLQVNGRIWTARQLNKLIKRILAPNKRLLARAQRCTAELRQRAEALQQENLQLRARLGRLHQKTESVNAE